MFTVDKVSPVVLAVVLAVLSRTHTWECVEGASEVTFLVTRQVRTATARKNTAESTPTVVPAARVESSVAAAAKEEAEETEGEGEEASTALAAG